MLFSLSLCGVCAWESPVYEKLIIKKKVLVLLRLGSGLGYELGLGLMLVLGLGIGFRVQICVDPEILGPRLSTDSEKKICVRICSNTQ